MNEGDVDVPKRSHTLRIVNLLTVCGGIGLLALSLWPGYLIGLWLVLAFPAIAVLGIIWLFIVIRAVPKPAGRGEKIPPRQIIVAPIIVCVTLFLLVFYIPRRIVFRVCMSQFENRLKTPPGTQPVAINTWLGIYRVDKIATDPRGGVYFRTGTGADMIDQLSYGFARQPNPEGSPFGNADYQLHPLTRDWYWFEVSDDW